MRILVSLDGDDPESRDILAYRSSKWPPQGGVFSGPKVSLYPFLASEPNTI